GGRASTGQGSPSARSRQVARRGSRYLWANPEARRTRPGRLTRASTACWAPRPNRSARRTLFLSSSFEERVEAVSGLGLLLEPFPSSFESGCSRWELLSCLLVRHVVGVPVRPIRVRLAYLGFVLTVRYRRATKRACQIAHRR